MNTSRKSYHLPTQVFLLYCCLPPVEVEQPQKPQVSSEAQSDPSMPQ